MAGEAEAAERKLVLAHEALRNASGLQLDFNAATPPTPPPGWLLRLLNGLAHGLVEIAPLMKFVFWGGLAVGALFIGWWIAREALGLRPRSRPIRPPVEWRPDADVALALLADADGLAAAGRFDEAIHLLLFRSIGDLAQRRPGAVRPSFTSRDIAALDAMPAGPRAAFARIAEAVEQAVFAARPLSAEDFQQRRQDYEAFAFPEGWR
jgi:hypothetical protein